MLAWLPKILDIFDARQVKSVTKETRLMTPRFLELRNSLPLQVAIAIAKTAALLIRGMISLFVQLPVTPSPRRPAFHPPHLLWWQLDR
jgi:hypothetical protein